ncbi:unnamed protein product [Chondrus crispus]|uniref:ATPase of the ABC class n=1 Tax=Chondrus crispus TaxID=2769 RepID=R7QIK7_CHOCR|nr:unnamed protein product [Chondrus crispus]CDF37904.1 unnamed protein product [Chondrus crispus]|eukprot:XP_005717775.1 unnamed protein product [Chondrus crispus]
MAPYSNRGSDSHRGSGGYGRGGRGRGRGAYYANKYGRGRGRGGGGQSDNGPGQGGGSRRDPQQFQSQGGREELAQLLHQMSGGSYPRYKDLIGKWGLMDATTLFFDRIQSDPYAPPSRARLRVELSSSGFDTDLYSSRIRQTAFCDFLTRKFWRVTHDAHMDRTTGGGGWSGPKGGNLNIDKPSQHVLERTSCLIVDDCFIEMRFTVNLPARGRTIQGQEAASILTERLPNVVAEVLFAQSEDSQKLLQHVTSIEDQEFTRNVSLGEHGLVAFVCNGAVLPRSSGADDEPMDESAAVPFESPESLFCEIELPSGKKVQGMGIKPGISLIVGGGFHGKSTLLAALEVGIYNHIPGDGREFVCLNKTGVSIRAEDGRSITGVNISPFINNLPFGKKTTSFCTPDASGSTSQAANIIEALEAGAKVLLTDEDLAATNFMMRDQRMQQLVPSSKEPITPMIQRIRSLYEEEGVSSILVIGGAGDYFEVSDLVVMMDCYKPRDVTNEAKSIASSFPSGLKLSDSPSDIFKTNKKRLIASDSVQRIAKSGRGKISVRVKGTIEFGSTEIDLSAMSQIVETSQTRAIAVALESIAGMSVLDRDGIGACVRKLMSEVDATNLDAMNSRGERQGNYARPRAIEIHGALSRLRGVDLSR